MDETLDICQRELAILERLGRSHGHLPQGARGSPIAARAFAETLILCSSEAEAKAQMQADPKGAAEFLSMARWFLAEAASGRVKRGGEFPAERLSFYAIASVVIELTNEIRKL